MVILVKRSVTCVNRIHMVVSGAVMIQSGTILYVENLSRDIIVREVGQKVRIDY